MKAIFKRRWVSDLRSGQYRQGHGLLKLNEQYCCLGVLAEQLAEMGMGVWQETKWAGVKFACEGTGSLTDIPDPLADVVGLTNSERIQLVHMNDELGWPFHKIADWIETYVSEEE